MLSTAGKLSMLVGWLVGFLTSSSTTSVFTDNFMGDHGFCFRSHYTDTDPTSRERAATAGIEPGSSSPGVARSTAELPRHLSMQMINFLSVFVKVENFFRARCIESTS